MPLPNLHALCGTNQPGARLCITMPGGAEICAIFPDARIPDPSELINALFQSFAAALAPFAPIFDIIEVLIAIVECLKAFQKAIASFPPRPDKLLACFPRLARAIGKLLAIIPPLSIPVMVGNFLDALITLLSGIRNQLLSIIRKTLQIAVAATTAKTLGSDALTAALSCAQSDLDSYMANLGANAKPIGQLLEIVNEFLSLAGIDPIKPVQIGTSAQDAVAPLDVTITVLQDVRLFFP